MVGYSASGRGRGPNPNLTARLLDVYPSMTEAQANGFILKQWRAGKSEKKIFKLIEARRKEWEQLETTLDLWRGSLSVPEARLPYAQSRIVTVQALKTCWQNAPLAADVADAAKLYIAPYEPLPELTADFSHVRELSIEGNGVFDANADVFLSRFANVETLSLGLQHPFFDSSVLTERTLTTVPSAVKRMAKLKSLRFTTPTRTLASNFPKRLQALTSVEALHFKFTGYLPALPNLDLKPLRQLKSLRIEAPTLSQWPASVERLQTLERLDLVNTSIAAIPQALYTGHEKLWAGLSMNWSKFPYEAFKPAYEYVKNYTGPLGHLVDLDEMVRGYCTGELQFLIRQDDLLSRQFMTRWSTPETRLKAVEALRLEHHGIFRSFYQPTASGNLRTSALLPRWLQVPNFRIHSALEKNWRAAVRGRYLPDATQPHPLLDPTPGYEREVLYLYYPEAIDNGKLFSELPTLPVGAFSHVRNVELYTLRVPVEQIRGFLPAFTGARGLTIDGAGLTEVPIAPGELEQLTKLDLARNEIESTPTVQRQLNGLKKLENLSMRENKLTAFDASSMTGLQTLNLYANKLTAWPTGVENLPDLNRLDLRNNNIGSLPDAVLANDALLLKIRLAGNRFTPAGETALAMARQRIEAAKGLPEGALKLYDTESSSSYVDSITSPPETALSRTSRLLPLRPRSAAVEGVTDLSSRVQELNPLLSSEQAGECVARLRKDGLSDAQIDARISEWQASDELLTRQLNGWIFRSTPRPRIQSEQSTTFAARKIRDCWLDGLTAYTDDAGRTLDLSGLQTGDLPILPQVLSRVRTLNLTGTRFSPQNFNEFCAAFPELSTLVLSGNQLRVVPEGVSRLIRLERLDMSSNRLVSAQSVYQQAGGPRLGWLDLSHNQLDEFNAAGFSRLQTLNLAGNSLDFWPEGVLDLAYLQTLDVSNNDITFFPDRLLDRNHARLVAGTDLSGNELALNSLEQLRDYSTANAGRAVMGYSQADLQRGIAQRELELENLPDAGAGSSQGPSGSGGATRVDPHARVEAPEVIADPSKDISAQAMETWLEHAAPDERATRQALWQQLAEEANHEPFFHLLTTLPATLEFKQSGADLTNRVWQVIQAASENTELREVLFLNAQTHGTCPDGRILSFSELETRVYVYNALRDIPRNRLEQRGRALLNLTRRLFRLERIDRLAEAAAKNKDRAEVRLQYRIGMIDDWPDGLELPAQPKHMLYDAPIHGQRLINARNSVLADEASDLFLEDLIARDYWIRYLEDRHSEVFDELQANATRRQEEVEDAHPDRDDEASIKLYVDAMSALEVELAQARIEKLNALTRAELARLAPPSGGEPQPGPSRPGPSRRN
ncbi:MAG TPA: NEL-type E3 ubiquitin ligase domain-containing protein [Pseudomonas sp.]|uniref:NEL-type E3 ubiquitin ligase domain-containing protein n=1 Tax=Pseudomonas sp. TaxID=306 RepID=UPI002CE2A51F|nr:NEL-type E3 ubiquitin ligase domain-containing protein [Pseudomonas sp.]HWH87768.1 NEL-type E3 ubiquitin ligase domain-containing protein [Pseudomonas sp.]